MRTGNWPFWYPILVIILIIVAIIISTRREKKAEQKLKSGKNKDGEILKIKKNNTLKDNGYIVQDLEMSPSFQNLDVVDENATIRGFKNEYIKRSTLGLKKGIRELELLLSNQKISPNAFLEFKEKKMIILDELFCLNLSLIDQEVFRQFGHKMRVKILDEEYYGKAMASYLHMTKQEDRDNSEFIDYINDRIEYWGAQPFPGEAENNLLSNFSRFIAESIGGAKVSHLHFSLLQMFFFEYHNNWLLEANGLKNDY